MPDAAPHPFATLTPDFVLDALASVGLVGDGRLMALNSYENRVYLAHLEPGTPLDVSVDLTSVEDGVLVQVATSVDLVGECVRCLESIEAEIVSVES